MKTWRALAVVLLPVVVTTGLATHRGGDHGYQQPFRHKDHVPRRWFDPGEQERLRDCRGCHAYSSAAGKSHDPQQVCLDCHGRDGGTFKMSASQGFETSLAPLRDDG